MFKGARWRGEKNKIKAVFKFQFKATQVPQLEWKTMMVSLVPLDAGRPTSQSEKAVMVDGACHWVKPVFETVKLNQDQKTGKINERVYQFIVSATGSTKSGLLGETTINLTDYAEVFKPSSISLPLRPSTTGAILHVTVHRMQGDVEARESDENGDTIQHQQRTLKSQFSNCEEQASRVANGTKSINSIEEGTLMNSLGQLRFPSSRTLHAHADSKGELRKSSSSEAISASGSDSSSGLYTPKENRIKKNYDTHQDSASIPSLLNNSHTPPNPMTNSNDLVTEYRDLGGSNVEWSISSAPDGRTGESTNNSGDNGWRERLQDPDVKIEKLRDDAVVLARQVEISELELQTLRKQVAKESRRGQDLQRELSNLKDERDTLRREYEELKTSLKISSKDVASVKSKFDDKDPWPTLEEITQELNHEKNLNSNLHLQLQKTQEANSELILAVRDLDELLEQKNRESSGWSVMAVKLETSKVARDIVDQFVCLQSSESKPESLEIISEHDDEEQCELEKLVKEHDDVKVGYPVEQQIVELKREVEFYRKDREDLEMQMEQLALDYEILKQENHDISSKLEQTQLQEQLRVQYECSAHLALISELEAHAESLEKELTKQTEAFETDIESIMRATLEQEQRAIQAEEALRMTKWKNANTAERLQEEFKGLSAQMSSTFYANEKLAMQAITEASKLHLEKCHLEELLEKTNEDLASAQIQYQVNLQELSSLTDMKTKEIDKLALKLKNKCEDIESLKKSEETKQKALSEEILVLKAEMENIVREKNHFSKQVRQREDVLVEMDKIKARTRAFEKLLQDRNVEKNMLERELASLKEDSSKLNKELNDLQHLKEDNEETIRYLSSNMEALKMQYSELKNSFFVDHIEKETLRIQAVDLSHELHKKDVMLAGLEIQCKDGDGRLPVSDESGKMISKNKTNNSSLSPNSTKEVPSLHEHFNLLEDNLLNKQNWNVPAVERNASAKFNWSGMAHLQEVNNGTLNLKRASATNFRNAREYSLLAIKGDAVCTYDPNNIDRDVKIRGISDLSEKNKESSVSCSSDQINKAEVLSEITVLKECNLLMEAELKQMQQRYSEISLKFAEVEGERQQLVMIIRTLKNAIK